MMRNGTAVFFSASLLGLAISAANAQDRLSTKPPADAAAEVQINVCEPEQKIAAALNLKPRETPTEIWYFDTPALELLSHGRVVRLRTTGGRSDLTLKVANQSCGAIERAIPEGEGKCEYDMHGEKFVGALSLARVLDAKQAAGLRSGTEPLAAVLTATQQRFLQKPGLGALPDGIAPMGPARVVSYRRAKGGFEVEVWTLPGGESFVEISEKARYSSALKVRAALERELAAANLKICKDQGSQAGEKLRILVRKP
ncbi:MAG: hypothetical protein ACREBN_03055 [Burkholderiaceae bacterium]